MPSANGEAKVGEGSADWKLIKNQILTRDKKIMQTLTSYLSGPDKGRLTNLKRLVLFIHDQESENIKDFGIYNLGACILRLTVHSYQLTEDDVIDMMNFINTEARHFPTSAIILLVEGCLKFMGKRKDVDLPVRWVEIFGKLVAVVATRGEIEFEGDTIDGQEFKNHVIVSICRVPWGQNNGASVIAALREIPGLSTEEIELILDRAATSMKDLDPTAIPPIAYQLLLLAGASHSARLIHYFDEYFHDVCHEELAEDAEKIVLGKKKRALGTTVFHFVQGAKTTDGVLKELLKRIKASQHSHTLVTQPFMLSVALGLTSIEYIKQTVLDALRTTILRLLAETQVGNDSAWQFSLLIKEPENAPTITIQQRFTVVIETKTSELDFMFDGLKELAVWLVNSDQLVGPTQRAKESCKKLGTLLLERIVAKQNTFLPTLMNEFLKNQSSLANIECLAKCLSKVKAYVMRKQYFGRLHELIHHLPLMTVETAEPILKALLPAFQLSSDLLGEVLMILRKTIWKSVEARLVSVTAMILLLSNSTIVGQIPKNQYSMSLSQQAGYSQAPSHTDVLGSSTKNESLCFEVLSILKRFFSQQLEVREHLYLRLETVVRKNPELIGIMCSHIQSQVRQHMSPDLKSLILKNVLECNSNGDVLVLDNLGLLIQTMCSVTLKGQRVYGIDRDPVEPDQEPRPSSLVTCESFVNTWVSIVLGARIEDFEIEAADILTKSGGQPKSLDIVRYVRNVLLIQVMQVIEALIEFYSLGGVATPSNKVKVLYKKFLELVPALKPKPAKKDGKGRKKAAPDKTNNANDTLQSTAASSSSAGNPKAKVEPPKKLVYMHILSAESLCHIVCDLYCSEDVAENPLREVKNLMEFDKFILDTIKEKVVALKSRERLKEKVTSVEKILKELTKSCYYLWQRLCLNVEERLELTSSQDEPEEIEKIEFQNSLDELRLELIAGILALYNQRSPNSSRLILSIFLQESEDKGYDHLFKIFFRQWRTHFKEHAMLVSNVAEHSTHESKAVHLMFKILEIVAKELTVEDNHMVYKVFCWLETLMGEKPTYLEPSVSLLESVLEVFIPTTFKYHAFPKSLIPLAKQAHYVLGDIDEEEMQTPQNPGCWLVTKDTAVVLIYHLKRAVDSMLDMTKGVIGRLGVPFYFYDAEDLFDTLRKRTCRNMRYSMAILTELVRSDFPPGPCVDMLQKTVLQFFTLMTSLTEHMIQHHVKSNVAFNCTEYEYLVKCIGKDFKMRAEALINQIERLRREEPVKGKGKKVKPAAMKHKFTKDARTIPVLVYSIEKYEQQLIALCNKTKVNLLDGTKLSTARDFKIEMGQLQKLNRTAAHDPPPDDLEDEEVDEVRANRPTLSRRDSSPKFRTPAPLGRSKAGPASKTGKSTPSTTKMDFPNPKETTKKPVPSTSKSRAAPNPKDKTLNPTPKTSKANDAAITKANPKRGVPTPKITIPKTVPKSVGPTSSKKSREVLNPIDITAIPGPSKIKSNQAPTPMDTTVAPGPSKRKSNDNDTATTFDNTVIPGPSKRRPNDGTGAPGQPKRKSLDADDPMDTTTGTSRRSLVQTPASMNTTSDPSQGRSNGTPPSMDTTVNGQSQRKSNEVSAPMNTTSRHAPLVRMAADVPNPVNPTTKPKSGLRLGLKRKNPS